MTSSSTSDDPAIAPGAPETATVTPHIEAQAPTRLAGAIRLVHPFPSILDGVVVALVAVVAGGDAGVAARLGVSMTLLQFAIGALNDVVDAPRDAGRKPGKPIPAGLVPTGIAGVVAAACAAIGLLIAIVGGPALALLAGAGLAVGVVYDLRLKGTTLSWLPLAIGIPILPVYGWFGATGTLPGAFVVLVPAAANAGTALGIANAIVDMERDEEAGIGSIALALGSLRASALVIVLQLVVAGLAIGTATVVGVPPGWMTALIAAACAPVGGALLGLIAATRAGTALRELAWEVQALGTALLAVAWLGAVSASGGIAPGS